MARSSDDSKCNYWSLQQGEAKEDLVEEDIKDSVRLQKMFRKLQRQIHSPDHQVKKRLITMKWHFFLLLHRISLRTFKVWSFCNQNEREWIPVRAVTSKDFINVPKLTNWQTDKGVLYNYWEVCAEPTEPTEPAGVLNFPDEKMQLTLILFTQKYYIGKIHAELTSRAGWLNHKFVLRQTQFLLLFLHFAGKEKVKSYQPQSNIITLFL